MNKFLNSLKLVIIFSLVLGAYVTPASVNANITTPSFSSCPNPTGQIIASYSTGPHAIAGNSNIQYGSDQVYLQSDNNVVQCYCPQNGSVGIQTNWLRADTISQSDINNLISQGWILIPNGSGWGLDSIPYLAYNLNFSCQANPTPAPQINTASVGGAVSAPICSNPMPDAPKLLSVTKVSATSIKLTWSDVPQATDYAIFYGLSSKNYTYGVPSTGKVTSYTIGNLDPNATYYFSVIAVDGCEPSNQSNEATPALGQVLGASTLAATSSNTTPYLLGFLAATSGALIAYGFKIKKSLSI